MAEILYLICSKFMDLKDRAGIEDLEVEFIGRDSSYGPLSFEAWTDQTNDIFDTDQLTLVTSYIQDICKNECAYDQQWAELNLGRDVVTTAIPFYCSGTEREFLPEAKTFDYMLSDAAVEELTASLERQHGEGNVFVSRQCIPALQMVEDWKIFYEQAWERLAMNNPYWIHRYDTQIHPGGQPLLPLYMIPVSIKTSWDRRIRVEEFLQKYQKLFECSLTTNEMTRILRCVSDKGKALSSRLYDRERVMDTLSSELFRYGKNTRVNTSKRVSLCRSLLSWLSLEREKR